MSTQAEERKRATRCLYCPRCGKHHHPWLRSIDGMWIHLTCVYCDCRFSYRTLSEAEKLAKHAEKMRRYRAEHPDRVRESQRKYRETHRKQIAEKARKWRSQNREKIKTRNREYKRSHPEKVVEHNRRYRERHRDDIKLRRVLRQLEETGAVE